MNTSLCVPDKITVNNVDYAVTLVGRRAFYNCKTLEEAYIPSSVPHESSIFAGCNNLTTLSILPTYVIGDYSEGYENIYACIFGFQRQESGKRAGTGKQGEYQRHHCGIVCRN